MYVRCRNNLLSEKPIDKKDYKKTSKVLQIELLKAQQPYQRLSDSALGGGDPVRKVAMAAGKGGSNQALPRTPEPMSLAAVNNVVAAYLSPNDAESDQVVFTDSYVSAPAIRPANHDVRDRSWYNRAGVEKVMEVHHATPQEHAFLFCARFPGFETVQLVSSGLLFQRLWFCRVMKPARSCVQRPARRIHQAVEVVAPRGESREYGEYTRSSAK